MRNGIRNEEMKMEYMREIICEGKKEKTKKS